MELNKFFVLWNLVFREIENTGNNNLQEGNF